MEGRFFELDAAVQTLREREARVAPKLVAEFSKKLDISMMYHDFALEGVVLAYSEIKAAIDKNIISDVSLIPSYEELKCFDAAMSWVREQVPGVPAALAKDGSQKDGAGNSGATSAGPSINSNANNNNKKKPLTLDSVKKLYSIISPDESETGFAVRKENPLHRLYYHEISPPDKIKPRLVKFQEWLEQDSTCRMHPVDRAARAHYRLMNIFPWTSNMGRVARVFSNLMLLRDGYPLAILHSSDRQRYYEMLRGENYGLVPLYVEASIATAETALKFYDEARASASKLNRRAAG